MCVQVPAGQPMPLGRLQAALPLPAWPRSVFERTGSSRAMSATGVGLRALACSACRPANASVRDLKRTKSAVARRRLLAAGKKHPAAQCKSRQQQLSLEARAACPPRCHPGAAEAEAALAAAKLAAAKAAAAAAEAGA